MTEIRDTLVRLAAGDPQVVRVGLSLAREGATHGSGWHLDPRTQVLAQLAALFALDANTTSVRWAADRALAVGVRDQALVRVLLTTEAVAGNAQTVVTAARLGLALDLDIEIEGWDGD